MNRLYLACSGYDLNLVAEVSANHPALPWSVLISYHYFRDTDLAAKIEEMFSTPPRMFADCGAFSAFTQDVVIDVHEYAEWALANADLFEVVASLDVIGSADASHENFETLRRLGVPCIPVFHVGDPWELLDHYIAEGEEYIALGGMVGNPDTNRFVQDCFDRTQDQPHIFHGFGMTKVKQMLGYPWKSVDSTSWIGARFGNASVWDPDMKRLVKIRARTDDALNYASLIEAHGGDPKLLYDSKQKGFRHESAMVSAVAWTRMAAQMFEEDTDLYLAGFAGGDMGVWNGSTADRDPDKSNGIK